MSYCYFFCFDLGLCPPSLSSSDTEKVLRLDRGLETSIKPPLSLLYTPSPPSPLGIHFLSFDHVICSYSQGEAQCHAKLNSHPTNLRSPLTPPSIITLSLPVSSQTILDAYPHSQVNLIGFTCLLRTVASENHLVFLISPAPFCRPLDVELQRCQSSWRRDKT